MVHTQVLIAMLLANVPVACCCWRNLRSRVGHGAALLACCAWLGMLQHGTQESASAAAWQVVCAAAGWAAAWPAASTYPLGRGVSAVYYCCCCCGGEREPDPLLQWLLCVRLALHKRYNGWLC